ncbi:MAG: hypothetical protein NVS9B10_26470 [Nevskia sp.]
MNSPPYIDDDDRQAIVLTLGYFLSNRIEEGRAALMGLRHDVLESLYTAGLRLGVEAHTQARGSRVMNIVDASGPC